MADGSPLAGLAAALSAPAQFMGCRKTLVPIADLLRSQMELGHRLGVRNCEASLTDHAANDNTENNWGRVRALVIAAAADDPHGKLVWTIDLPVGSVPGHYDVELQQPRGNTVTRASGTANLVNGLTLLKIRIDTRAVQPGAASLRVHPPSRSWSRYAISFR